jgi:ABC-type transport system involved in multi-copper enzyme maturation permease subunit
MRAMAAIAQNTIVEALHRIFLQTVLAFAVLFLVGGMFLGYLGPGMEDKVLKDLGLSIITLFAMLMAVFIGVGLIQPEVERRTVYALLAKPVRRHEFVLGKFLGALVVIAACIWLMGGVFVLAIRFKQQIWAPELLSAVAILPLAAAIMMGLVMFFSTFTSSLLSVLIGFVIWGVGFSQSTLAYLGESTDSRFSRTMIGLVNTLLPRFDYFDWRVVIVDQLGLLTSEVVIKSIEYGLVYLAVVLALTVVVFNEKQF